MKVAVLGAGPAGLMAAHAAMVSGADVSIFSRKRKSELFGCQYLHAPIPGMTDVAPVEVNYSLHGDVESYRQKVYGADWQGDVSPEDLIGQHTAWDIRRTYDNLWDEYHGIIHDIESIEQTWLGRVIDLGRFDRIINSVPKSALCKRRHTFSYQEVWAVGDAPERGLFAPNYTTRNHIVCNGLASPSWYRAANVFGYTTVEWPFGKAKPGPGVNLVTKPLAHDCDCWPDLISVGRYGRWEKGVLSHTAFEDVTSMLVTEPIG